MARTVHSPARMKQARPDSGQAAVETALVMPLTVFLILGILQLAVVQQARLMTEYAAFQAVRAGIVWSGNNERMHDAALWALLPTLGRTDGMAAVGRTWEHASKLDLELHDALAPVGEGKVPEVLRKAGLLGLVRVDTLNPAGYPALDSLWNLSRSGGKWEELDFDGPDSLPESPGLEAHLDRFYDLRRSDSQQELYRRATVLTVRLRYLYELRIPFANWIVFASWFAANAGRSIAHRKGLATATPAELRVLWSLAHGALRLGRGEAVPRFFLPLTATSSLRMQSNFHRKWLVHNGPDWEP